MTVPYRPAANPAAWPHAFHRLSFWLTARGVRHVVIGGVATACFVPERVPRDLDVVLAPTARTASAAERALTALVLEAEAAGEDVGAVPPFSATALAAGAELMLPTRRGPLHVVGASLPAGVERRALVARRTWRLVGPWPVPICARASLIDLKARHAGMTDLDDVIRLERSRQTRSAPQ